jgi:hypothetical protein
MFGFLKSKADPVGPFEFGHTVDIERPAPDVYALVDWADPRNAKRALGNKVEQVGTSPDRYRMRLDLLPDHVFEMIVTEVVPGQIYAFKNESTPSVGKLVGSHETYRVEPLDEESCRLHLLVSASFVGGMSDRALAREI